MIQAKRDHKFSLDWCIKIPCPGRKPFRIGLTIDSLGPAECIYMFRIVLWLEPLFCLRLHKIMRSDNDSHLHDHPWWFVTFPLGTYNEWLSYKTAMMFKGAEAPIEMHNQKQMMLFRVKGWRFHYRPAEYQHAVVVGKPTWTFVITGTRMRDWGFWVADKFVQWKIYDRIFGQTARPCSDPVEKK